MTFRVGQKVCCVDSSLIEIGPWRFDPPVIGEVYTITGFSFSKGEPHLYLREIENFPIGYRARRFRPIVSRKTDISTLTALLVPGAKIREDA